MKRAIDLGPRKIQSWVRGEPFEAHDFGSVRVCKRNVHAPARSDSRTAVTFEFPNWVLVVPITETKKIVMVWQYRVGTDEMCLEIPGGCIEPGESWSDAAARELREETGYAAKDFRLISTFAPNPEHQSNTLFVVGAHGAYAAADPAFDEAEECEVVLVPEADADTMLEEGKVTNLLVFAALHAFLAREDRARENPAR